jgi:hypothetical protein
MKVKIFPVYYEALQHEGILDSKSLAPCFLNLGIRQRWAISSTHWERAPVSIKQETIWIRCHNGTCGENKNFIPAGHRTTTPRSSSPQPSLQRNIQHYVCMQIMIRLLIATTLQVAENARTSFMVHLMALRVQALKRWIIGTRRM